MPKNIYKVLSLFSGIGGLCHHGIEMAGLSHKFKVTQFVENSIYAQGELQKLSPTTPIHSNIINFHLGNREINVICGGSPCAGTSNAGLKKGFEDPRSGLWHEMFRIVQEYRRTAFKKHRSGPIILFENPEGILNNGFGTIINQMDSIGYNTEWNCISAKEVGLPQKRRNRLLLLGYPNGLFLSKKPQPWQHTIGADIEGIRLSEGDRIYQPGVSRVVNGLSLIPIGVNQRIPGNFDARRAYGLSCSPRQSAIAWKRIDYLTSLIR